MSQQNLHELAIRKKYRFPSVQGELTPEQLYDLPLKSKRASDADLNSVAVALHQEIKLVADTSFVDDDVPPASADLQNRFELVKHIIDVKKREIAAAKVAAQNNAARVKIAEIRNRKQDAALEDKSIEELDAILAEMEAGNPVTVTV